MPLFSQFSAAMIDNNYRLLGEKIMAGKKNIDYDSLIGKKYSKWTIVSYFSAKQCIMINCICECGTNSNIQSNALINGRSKSCKFCAPKKHGLYNTPTNRSWSGARNRCNNANNRDYANYGGCGIIFSERWLKFENFLSDMGQRPEGLSLDRINNDGNYEPGNCRWATPSEQNSNQRKRNRS